MVKTKKVKKIKTPEQRKKEIDTLREKILSIGFPTTGNESIETLLREMDIFVEKGYSYSAVLKCEEHKVNFHCLFSTQPHIICSVNIERTGIITKNA